MEILGLVITHSKRTCSWRTIGAKEVTEVALSEVELAILGCFLALPQP